MEWKNGMDFNGNTDSLNGFYKIYGMDWNGFYQKDFVEKIWPKILCNGFKAKYLESTYPDPP